MCLQLIKVTNKHTQSIPNNFDNFINLKQNLSLWLLHPCHHFEVNNSTYHYYSQYHCHCCYNHLYHCWHILPSQHPSLLLATSSTVVDFNATTLNCCHSLNSNAELLLPSHKHCCLTLVFLNLKRKWQNTPEISFDFCWLRLVWYFLHFVSMVREATVIASAICGNWHLDHCEANWLS